jgi:hypothetical protein
MVGLICFFIYLALGIFEIEGSSSGEVDSRKAFGVWEPVRGGYTSGSALLAKSAKMSQELFKKMGAEFF